MNADCAFRMGATHTVCQDYALANTHDSESSSSASGSERFPYIVVTDGCSSSSDSDVGARLLARAAEQLIKQTPALLKGTAEIHSHAAHVALDWAAAMRLPAQAVDATLLSAHISGPELVIGCSGDGVVCLKARDGEINLYTISYKSGYPFYPAYAHQPARLASLQKTGPDKEVKHFRRMAGEDIFEVVSVYHDDRPTEVFTVNAGEYEWVALFTDGIHSFYSNLVHTTARQTVPIAVEQILSEIVSFRTLKGAFVQRRLIRFLKECSARGWHHRDDLTVGAIHLGDRLCS